MRAAALVEVCALLFLSLTLYSVLISELVLVRRQTLKKGEFPQ